MKEVTDYKTDSHMGKKNHVLRNARAMATSKGSFI